MKRKETQRISDVLREIVKEASYERKLMETRLINNWKKVLGPGISSSTGKMYIAHQTLFVHIESPVMRHELSMMRTKIKDALNQSVGQDIINNIIFR